MSIEYGANGISTQGQKKRLRQSFDASNNITLSRSNLFSGTNEWGIVYDSFSYAGNKMTSSVINSVINKEHRVYKYNALGTLDTMIIGTAVFAYTYNSSGKLTTQYFIYAGTIDTLLYDYNSSGQLIGEYTHDYRKEYSYDLSGDVQMDQRAIRTGTATWMDFDKRYYWYDASHKKTSDIYIAPYNGVWLNRVRYEYTYNADGLVQEIRSSNYNPIDSVWGQFGSDSLEFASAHNVRFYYETYFATGIKEQFANNADIKLYPSPASSFINVEINKVFNKTFKAAIYDMQGRVIRTWDEPATRHYSKTLPVNELTDGVYFFRVNTDEGDITRQFSIIR